MDAHWEGTVPERQRQQARMLGVPVILAVLTVGIAIGYVLGYLTHGGA
jgi:hypothetical protein